MTALMIKYSSWVSFLRAYLSLMSGATDLWELEFGHQNWTYSRLDNFVIWDVTKSMIEEFPCAICCTIISVIFDRVCRAFHVLSDAHGRSKSEIFQIGIVFDNSSIIDTINDRIQTVEGTHRLRNLDFHWTTCLERHCIHFISFIRTSSSVEHLWTF